MNASNDLDTESDVCTAMIMRRSLDTDWVDEADRFKWIESQKAGRDLGEAAIRQWVKDHWWGYLRARWLEHLQGNCFWIELDRGDFGLLHRAFQDEKGLLDQIVNLLKDGQENLGIISWACRNQIPLGQVICILESLDINAKRLIHKFDPTA
jgi:hypothetical protein